MRTLGRAIKWLAIVLVLFITLYTALILIAFSIDLFVPGKEEAHWRDVMVLTENPLDLSPSPPEFAKTATLMGLSQAAVGLLNLEYSAKVDLVPLQVRREVAKRLVELSSDERLRFAEQPWSGLPAHGFGIYYSHRLLVLCTNRIISAEPAHDEEIDTTVDYLERESKRADFHGIVPPYSPRHEGLFPADQSMVLLSLFVCGRARETLTGRVELEFFLREQELHPLFAERKVHTSGWNYRYSSIPRGVGLGYELSNLSRIDPLRFRDLYERHKAEFEVSFGPFTGFREWPRGEENSSDLDSGPVFFGIGAAASALSIQAAKLQRDDEVTLGVSRLGALLGFPFRWNGARRFLTLILVRGIGESTPSSTLSDLVKSMDFFARTTLFANETTTATPWPLGQAKK